MSLESPPIKVISDASYCDLDEGGQNGRENRKEGRTRRRDDEEGG